MVKVQNNSNKAVVYVRVSSQDQVSGTSLETQEKSCREFITRNGWEVDKVFTEKGQSAKTTNRDAFNGALAYATKKQNNIGYFVVYKLDRFARNQDDHATVSAFLKRNGCKLRSATEPIDDSPVGRLTEGVLSAYAEFDNNVRGERTKSGLVKRLSEGLWVFREPLGYYRPGFGKNITPHPEVAPFVKMIFEEYAKGVYTYKALAAHLAERGFRTAGGKKPSQQLMEKILRNPVYYGKMCVQGAEYEGKFTPIISKELFDKCQPGYKSNASHAKPRSANNPEFPLRGLFICSECGQSYTGSKSTSRNGTKHPYYHHQKQGCTEAKFIPKAEFETNFIKFLESITPNSRYEQLFKKVVVEVWRKNYKQLDNENAKIRRDIESLEQQRQQVFSFHQSGKYTDEEFLEQKQLVNNQIAEKRLLVQEKVSEEMNMEEALDYCFKFVRDTARVWQMLESDYHLRLRFQKRIFPTKKAPYDGTSFGTSDLSPIYKLNQQYQNKKSTLVALRRIELRLPG